MNKRNGYLKIADIRGVPIFIHWTFPAGGILFSTIAATDFRQLVYYCIAYSFLVIAHESGHAMAAHYFRVKVFSIELSGAGGRCHFNRPRFIRHSLIIYSAGLIAQAVIFLATLAYINHFSAPESSFGVAMAMTFTYVNLVIFVINLIPSQNNRSGLSTDGMVLWKLFRHVVSGHPHPHPPLVITPPDTSPVFPPDTRLLQKPGFRPPGFVHGIEVLSDRTTPIEFVVASLMNHLKITRDAAIVKTLDIHNTGGILIPLGSAQEAQRIADAVATEARAAGHPLVCRYACTR